MNNRIAVYYRVSTDRQNIDSQRAAVERYIATQQSSSVVEYIDYAKSGKDNTRPNYRRMISDALAKRIDTIIVYKIDRFSRTATEAIRTILDLDDYGVAFVSVSQPILTNDRTNPFRRTMLAAFAELAEIEREQIVSRIREGMSVAVAKGKRIGRPAKPKPLHLVRQAHKLASDGIPKTRIAKELGVTRREVYRLLEVANG